MTAIVDEVPSTCATVRAAVDGDEAAFTRIVAAHHDDMVRVCYVISGDVELAREAAQAAWPIAWRKLYTLRDPERLRPWLVSVAANEVRLLLRRRRRREVAEINIDSAEARGRGEMGDPSERAAEVDLANALMGLSADDRLVVALRYVLGMTSTEIGHATGLSAAGARTRLARALARLRKDLDDV
jgi:RNA polymerase sigma factor (sigma-70 family)